MRESYEYTAIQRELEKKSKAADFSVTPYTIKEHDEILPPPKPLGLKEHLLGLRSIIREKIELPRPQLTAADKKEQKLLRDLVSPERLAEYKKIFAEFKERATVTEEHPQREFIDINDPRHAEMIDAWVANLTRDISQKNKLSKKDRQELEGSSWLLFEAAANVMNTRSLEKDIQEYFERHREDYDEPGGVIQVEKDLVADLKGRYPLKKDELQIMVELVKAKGQSKEYNFKVLTRTLGDVWRQYGLSKKKGEVAKISFGFLVSQALNSAAPYLFRNLIKDDQLKAEVFLEVLGLNKASQLVDAWTHVRKEKLLTKIAKKINTRIVDSLFFQEFEFIHDKSLGEIFSTINRGKFATERMLGKTIAEIGPTAAGLGMSLGFLTKLSPIFGAVGLAGLPVMYHLAQKRTQKVLPIFREIRAADIESETTLGAVREDFEVVRSSAAIEKVAGQVKSKMDLVDDLSLKQTIVLIKQKLINLIPLAISDLVALGLGAALQARGDISGGAILSNIQYSKMLRGPIEDFIRTYFDDFARQVDDIEKMNEILGSYERLDLPESKKEKERLPVSQLKNFDLEIKDLSYKNILRDLNLKVKGGEFLVLAGPSGIGKTTLIRNIVGLFKPRSGKVALGGEDIKNIRHFGEQALRTVIGYANQRPQILPSLTLRENLTLWAQRAIKDRDLKAVLKSLHLDNFVERLDEKVSFVSGGELVRLGIARTLIKKPRILILDEPTASLDSRASHKVREIIAELHKSRPKTTIIVVTHDEDLAKIGDRVVDVREIQKKK